MGMENGWIKKNMRKIATVGMATLGGLAVTDTDAQGFFHKKDKVSTPTEQLDNQVIEKSPFQSSLEEFTEKYKSDDLHYRAVAVGKSTDQQESISSATDLAHNNILNEINSEKATLHNIRKINSVTYKFSDGTYQTIVAVEVSKDNTSDVK